MSVPIERSSSTRRTVGPNDVAAVPPESVSTGGAVVISV